MAPQGVHYQACRSQMSRTGTKPGRFYSSISEARTRVLPTVRCFCLSLLILSAPPAPTHAGAVLSTQRESDARLLELGKPTEREIAAGEAQNYQIALDTSQFLRVGLDRQGLNLYMALFGPDGKKLIEVNRASYAHGLIPIFFVTQAASRYRLEVRLPEGDRGPGRYKVSIEELRTATGVDRTRVAAEWTFVEGQQLFEQGSAQSLRSSIEKREAALSLYRALGDRVGEAKALTAIGLAYSELADNRKALDYYTQALPLYQAAGDHGGEAIVLGNIGASHGRLDDHKKAIGYYDQALRHYRAIGETEGEATTLSNIGVSHYQLSEYRKAADYFNQALPLQRAIGYRRGQVIALQNIGHAHAALGEWQEALGYFTQSLSLVRTMSIQRLEAGSLVAIGGVYSSLSEPQKALEFYNQALPLHRATGNRGGEANTLARIGRVNLVSGEIRQALDYSNQALSIFRAIGNRLGESSALRDIAQIYNLSGERLKALDSLNQSLAVVRAVGNRDGEAGVLNDIGAVYSSSNEYQKALDYFNQALSFHRTTEYRIGEAQALYNIARAHRGQGNLIEARSSSEAALRVVESLRAGVASPESRASFFASMRNYYDLNVDLLMQLHQRHPSEGFDSAALEASERARARSLLELLAEARTDIRQGVDAELLERERSLGELLNAKANRQRQILSGKHTPDQAEAAAKEMQSLLTKYQETQAHIRATSPRYAALTQPPPVRLKDIQQQALDADTLLLEYALGDDRSYLWAVSTSSITSYELPRRAEIEAAARRFYELAKADSEETQVREAADALTRMLLSPAAARLESKRLVIVPDGALHYVPFAALPAPSVQVAESIAANRIRTTEPRSLIADHELVTLPSASVLAEMRRDLAARRPAAGAVAVLADPVFSRDDPRMRQTSEQQAAPPPEQSLTRDFERALDEAGLASSGAGIPRLVFSRREAEAITSIAPAGQAMRAVGFEASRSTAMSAELGGYRTVHFATHGLLNSRHPELSGIVLSLVDREGRPQNGFLRLHEVYNLKLPAELVVLSACQTGLGKEMRGEGLVGLTRGFMYAGAARVVASLWKVDDAATAELMKRFYHGMLGKGLRPAAALRQAQVEMSRQKRWRSPYFWAAFVLQGEYK